MTISTNTFDRTNFNLQPFFIFVLIIAVLICTCLVFTEHSETSHAEQISAINSCYNTPTNQFSGWLQGTNGRWLQFCFDGGKYNYFRVYECSNGELVVVTQFKQALRKLSRYLTNGGYLPSDAPPCN